MAEKTTKIVFSTTVRVGVEGEPIDYWVKRRPLAVDPTRVQYRVYRKREGGVENMLDDPHKTFSEALMAVRHDSEALVFRLAELYTV